MSFVSIRIPQGRETLKLWEGDLSKELHIDRSNLEGEAMRQMELRSKFARLRGQVAGEQASLLARIDHSKGERFVHYKNGAGAPSGDKAPSDTVAEANRRADPVFVQHGADSALVDSALAVLADVDSALRERASLLKELLQNDRATSGGGHTTGQAPATRDKIEEARSVRDAREADEAQGATPAQPPTATPAKKTPTKKV